MSTLLLLAPSPKPMDAEPAGRDVGIIAGVIVCLALFIALILIIICYRCELHLFRIKCAKFYS